MSIPFKSAVSDAVRLGSKCSGSTLKGPISRCGDGETTIIAAVSMNQRPV